MDRALVENTGLKLEELDEKAVVYQSVFSYIEYMRIKNSLHKQSKKACMCF